VLHQGFGIGLPVGLFAALKDDQAMMCSRRYCETFQISVPTFLDTPAGEVPSFLYAMPLGGNRVFLEETCLVAKPALPFAVLKRRLERRLKAVGMKVGWSVRPYVNIPDHRKIEVWQLNQGAREWVSA
jgi:hypothetical protein